MTGIPSPESERRLLRWLRVGLERPISHQVVTAMSELGRAAEVIAAAIRATGEAGRGKSLEELLQRQEQIDTLAQLVGHVVAARDAVDAAAQHDLGSEKDQVGGSKDTLMRDVGNSRLNEGIGVSLSGSHGYRLQCQGYTTSAAHFPV